MSGAILLCGQLLSSVPQSAHAQELTFEFHIEYNDFSSQNMRFGLREDSLPGLDDHDLPEPPTVPAATSSAYLVMFEPPANIPNHWRYDLRPSVSLMADRLEMWQFNFHTAEVGGEATITIDSVGDIPVPYDLYFLGSGVTYEPLILPHSFTVTIDASETVFFWELQLTDAVKANATTWGGIKGLYR